MIVSHQGLNTTGNKIIRSHAHQGGRVHRLTLVSLGPAWSSIHPIIVPSPMKPDYRNVARSEGTFHSGLRWRPTLLQWDFLVGIGPDYEVGNVSLETRPPMRHAAGDDDHIALGEST